MIGEPVDRAAESLGVEVAAQFRTESQRLFGRVNERVAEVLAGSVAEGRIAFIYRGHEPRNFSARFTDDDAQVLCGVLAGREELLGHLDLSCNAVTAVGAIALGATVARAGFLRSLNLQHNRLGPEGGAALMEGLVALREGRPEHRLEYLNLEGCLVGPAGLLKTTVEEKTYEGRPTLVERLLRANEVIRDLLLGSNDLDDVCLLEIFAMLNPTLNACSLQSLSLDDVTGKAFSVELAFEISKVLKINRRLECLSLRKCRIADDVLNVMLKEVALNEVLRLLALGANLVSYKGCYVLAEYLKSPACGLAVLDLSRNQVGNVGAQLLFQALRSNQSLLHLDLNHNGVGREGLVAAAAVLRDSPHLASLHLFWNDFDRPAAEEFWKLTNDYQRALRLDFSVDAEDYAVFHTPEPMPPELAPRRLHFFAPDLTL